jgi:transposase
MVDPGVVEAGMAGLLAAALGRRGGRAEQLAEVVIVNVGHGRSMPPSPSTCRAHPTRIPMPAAPALHPTRRFPTDLTDAQWRLLAPLLPEPRSGPGRPGRPATCRRALVDAILYVLWTGCPWRALPDCYPHWRTVHHHFARWAADGTLGRLHAVLRARARAAAGRTVAPTAAIIDSQSVRASDWVPRASKGYDAAKKVHGHKRHVAVDTQGCCWTSWSPPPACRTATVAGGCCRAFATTCRPSAWSGLMPATPASWSPGPPRSSRLRFRSSASAWAHQAPLPARALGLAT